MKKGNIAIIILIIIAVLAIAGSIYYFSTRKISNITPKPTTNPEKLVGNDKDEHGCIGSAGYSWCELKQKCLRTWEEPCEVENEVLKTFISNALVAKHGNNAKELNITVSKIIGDYAQGGASGEGGGGMWFAAKVNNNWELVWDGNGIILCSDLTKYPDFPKEMIPECYNRETDKMVIRK